ncbi:MAG: hypothetical protein K5859_03540 [Atopobiaceae bacterium]|nr:hypothetical protein [Atopobiaceae bacterium]
MADARLGDVVFTAEGGRQGIGPDSHSGTANAAMFMVCRLLTDAIFSNDIRAIQLIINRIDGGLPKDVDMDGYRTRFSDCLSEIMHMERSEQLKLRPEDTVMMGLCKSLYALAVQDIYWDPDRGRMRRPSTDRKQERDAALRIILERLGGRKTLVAEARIEESVEDADWIAALPSGK